MCDDSYNNKNVFIGHFCEQGLRLSHTTGADLKDYKSEISGAAAVR